jgi:hypothetical protein
VRGFPANRTALVEGVGRSAGADGLDDEVYRLVGLTRHAARRPTVRVVVEARGEPGEAGNASCFCPVVTHSCEWG